jgi:hypothetical protein
MDHDCCPSGTARDDPPVTTEDARRALLAHAAATGALLGERAGSRVDYPRLLALLQDPDVVRFPVQVVFDSQPLHEYEVAYPLPAADDRTNGFIMYVRSDLATCPEDATAAILYALVVVNYGDAATGEVAEAFGAAALGVDPEVYYRTMCRIADRTAGNPD